MKFKKTTLVILILVLIVMTGCTKNKTVTVNPFMGDIDETVEDTGIAVFDDEYSITSVVNGKIISSNFSEGDSICKGEILYSLDDVDLKNQIEQVSISLEKANEAYRQSYNAEKDLTVIAHASGLVTSLYCHVGDYVSVGSRIADIVDSNNLILKIPFNASDKEKIYVGACAEITINNDGSKLYGTVSNVYDYMQALDGGKSGVLTEISIVNPGALKQGDKAFAMVGNIASLSIGEFANKTQQSISATQSGQVEKLFIKEGSKVTNGMSAMTIKNDAIKNAVKTASLQIKEIQTNLLQLKNKLSDYQIVSPIDGIITRKLAKVSDYASPNTPLAVIADAGNLYIDTDIDEMYINKIALGQTAIVNIQGSDDKIYNGSVIKKDDVGAAKSGVTYYTVRIKLDEHDDLMESMNVDVKIITDSKKNVMLIPIRALSDNKVNVLQGNKTVQKEVVTGIKNKEYAQIISGLGIDEKVVMGGAVK